MRNDFLGEEIYAGLLPHVIIIASYQTLVARNENLLLRALLSLLLSRSLPLSILKINSRNIHLCTAKKSFRARTCVVSGKRLPAAAARAFRFRFCERRAEEGDFHFGANLL